MRPGTGTTFGLHASDPTDHGGILEPMASPYAIRIVGDPVLKQVAAEVTDIDGRLVRLAEDMLDTMYEAPGLGLAAPQVGVQQRFFVYDLENGEDPRVLINPRITGSDGEWSYEEGCLSIPNLSFEIVRPKTIEVTGIDLDGNELTFEADELFARLIQHELDHLDGKLLLEHLDEDQLKEAKKGIREMKMGITGDDTSTKEPEPRNGFRNSLFGPR